MKTKELTIKQKGEERIKVLNRLKVFKDNSIVCVNAQWMQDGTTMCELYSRKTKKRVKIKTNIVFDNPEFIKDPNEYFKNKKIVQDIIKK